MIIMEDIEWAMRTIELVVIAVVTTLQINLMKKFL